MDKCIYCKIDTSSGQVCSDGDFICDECISEVMGDDE